MGWVDFKSHGCRLLHLNFLDHSFALLVIPWIRDEPHNGEFVGGGRECHRELLAGVALLRPGEVGA